MSADRLPTLTAAATPTEAVERLIRLHEEAVEAQRQALERFFAEGVAPTPQERAALPLSRAARHLCAAEAAAARTRRAYAKFQGPGIYATTVTQPAAFRAYLLEQLDHLVRGLRRHHRGRRQQPGDPLPLRVRARRRARPRRRHRRRAGPAFPDAAPRPRSATRSPTAPGSCDEGEPRPLALFDAVRIDYSLRRLVHYTGTDWRTSSPGSCSPTIIATSTSSSAGRRRARAGRPVREAGPAGRRRHRARMPERGGDRA